MGAAEVVRNARHSAFSRDRRSEGGVELTVLRGICFIYHKKCGIVLTLAYR